LRRLTSKVNIGQKEPYQMTGKHKKDNIDLLWAEYSDTAPNLKVGLYKTFAL